MQRRRSKGTRRRRVLSGGCCSLLLGAWLALAGGGCGSVSQAGSGVCTGEPLPCNAREQEECSDSCAWQTACSLRDCVKLRSADVCQATAGCIWDEVTEACRKSSEPCHVLMSQIACESNTECSWGPTCTGTPSACSAHGSDRATCGAALGCRIVIPL